MVKTGRESIPACQMLRRTCPCSSSSASTTSSILGRFSWAFHTPNQTFDRLLPAHWHLARYQVIHGEAVSIFDVSLNGFLIVTIFVNLPLGLGGFVCRACNIFLMSWKPDLLLPFLGFFEMLLFFLSSWILGKRTFPNHLRMRPMQRQNISRRLRLLQPMRCGCSLPRDIVEGPECLKEISAGHCRVNEWWHGRVEASKRILVGHLVEGVQVQASWH